MNTEVLLHMAYFQPTPQEESSGVLQTDGKLLTQMIMMLMIHCERSFVCLMVFELRLAVKFWERARLI